MGIPEANEAYKTAKGSDEDGHEEEGHEEHGGQDEFPWIPLAITVSFLIVLFIDRVVFDSHSGHSHSHDHSHGDHDTQHKDKKKVNPEKSIPESEKHLEQFD